MPLLKVRIDLFIFEKHLISLDRETQFRADYCIVGSLPTRDGPLCGVCMLLCVAPSFAVLSGVLMYVSYMGELIV